MPKRPTGFTINPRKRHADIKARLLKLVPKDSTLNEFVQSILLEYLSKMQEARKK